jgi:hypothetical protein
LFSDQVQTGHVAIKIKVDRTIRDYGGTEDDQYRYFGFGPVLPPSEDAHQWWQRLRDHQSFDGYMLD